VSINICLKKPLYMLLLFLASCSLFSPTQTPESLPSPSITFTPKPTNTRGVITTPTQHSTVTLIPSAPVPQEPTSLPPTWTPFPTLLPNEAQEFVAELLQTNANCMLPCWWGIVPGETTWTKAYQFLAKLSIYIGVTKVENQEVYASAQIPVPYPVDYATYLMQDYSIENGIVKSIEIYNFDLAPEFFLSRVLQVYKKPVEIWIRTFREDERSRPFLLNLFYPNQGILLEYGGGDIKDMGNYLQNCIDDRKRPYIYLWSPDDEMTFDEAAKKFLYTEDVSPISLKEATGMDVDLFYEEFTSNGKVCIQTPKELWP
jgi:hypothetical protein